MLDIHSHILPDVDDGAANIAEAIEILTAEAKDGVDKIFLTPHFNCTKESVDDFIARRNKSYELLNEAIKGLDHPKLRLGAEVRYSPDLLDIELHRLTLGSSVYLLLELSNVHYPTFIDQVIDRMRERQIVPIIAHVERCVYFRHNPSMLKELIDRGALAQVSAEVVMNNPKRSFAMSCLRHNLVQFVGSDVHNMVTRPPYMAKAMRVLGESKRDELEIYAEAVWNDWDIDPIKSTKPLKYFCKNR